MKRNRQTIIVTVVWLVAFTFLYYKMQGGPHQAVPPFHTLLTQAQKLEHDAGKDKGKLKNVARAYVQLGGTKEYKKSEEAAQARLHAGIIYETELKDDHSAEQTYTGLIQDFGKESAAAAEAQTRLDALKTRITAKHKHEIGYKAIDQLVALTGRNPDYSYALALLIITLVFKAVTTPLSHAQYKSMREMQKIQPLMKQLQEKFKDNQQELGKQMMALYKEHGVNPLSGCLPLLIQMPILIGLYRYVIQPYLYDFAKGHFLWIGSSLGHSFPKIVGANLSMPDIPLVIIYTISMVISQLLSVVDPSQSQEQKLMAYGMPIIFAFLFKGFPSAFMLYWLFFNVISTAQQYYILKHPSGKSGPASGTAVAVGVGQAEIAPVPPKKSPVAPGTKSRRRRRRFQIVRIPRPALQSYPAG